MSDTPAKPPCCVVGGRPDAGDIDIALGAGGPENSIRKVAARHALPPAAVQRHRKHLGIGDDTVIDTAADTRGDTLDTPADTRDTPATSSTTIPLPERPDKSARTMQLIPKAPGDDPVTNPRKLITAEIERRAVSMRVGGKEYDVIADELGIAEGTAMDVVERVLLRTTGRTNKNVETLRAIEMRRCDAIIAANWERGQDPAMAECEVPADTETGVRKYDGQDKANAIILKAMERRAKLAGIDTPAAPLVQINVLQDPAVLGMQRVQAAILDHLFPGASQVLADGFEAYRAHGTAGLGRFIEDQLQKREAITVEAEPLADHEGHPG